MKRFPAALVTSFIGSLIFAGSFFLPPNLLPSGISNLGYLILVVLMGGIAAVISVRHPQNAGKGGGEGALTGLIVGALMIGFSLVASLLIIFLAPFDAIVHTTNITINPGQGQDTFRVFAAIAIGFIVILLGILGLGLSTGIGAIAGAIAKRKVALIEQPVPSHA